MANGTMWRLWMLPIVGCLVACSGAETREAAKLTPGEQDIVANINRVRANPAAYAQTVLAPRRALIHDGIYRPREGGPGIRTHEGVAVLDEAIAELSATAPQPPLAASGILTAAARGHAKDQAATGAIGHIGSNGSDPAKRILWHGSWRRIGEVISYGQANGADVVAQLVIDDGVKSRGHRRIILTRQFGLVGVGQQTHPKYGHAAVVDVGERQ